MRFPRFHSKVASLVAKVTGQPLGEVDPDFNIGAYFPGEDSEPKDLETAAQECASTILFEAGYPVEA
jgi:hypothetical protein